MTSRIRSTVRRLARIPGRWQREADHVPPSADAPEEGSGAPGPPEPWTLVDLVRDGEVWVLQVRLPEVPALTSADLVLVGRTTQVLIAIPMGVGSASASALIRSGLLAALGPEPVDVWVEVLDLQGTRTRQRVALADPAVVDDLSGSSVPGARWYVTVKGNLSLELSPPVSALSAPDRPTLVEFAELGPGLEATLSISADPVPGGEPCLLLVGRRTRHAVRLVLAREAGRWSVTVHPTDLAVLDRWETVDVLLEGTTPDGVHTRRPVAAGAVELVPRAGAPRRWSATSEGDVHLRRPTPVEVINEAGVFDTEFYLAQVSDQPAGLDPVEHYVQHGAAAGLDPAPMFETRYYQANNPAVRRNPLAHYCESGWKELRNPSPRFNTWWYWFQHLDPSDERTNPLAHFQAVGARQGLSTLPEREPSRALGDGHRFADGHRVRRLCLFAAYDPDGIVDDYVVDYVRELAKHADVYYWADSEMLDPELAKLSGLVRGVWAERHGEYDFGSYARLAEAVGWATIEQYDELLLVNDSCYLLRPLDEVFARMDAKSCDWWGLQATKGLRQTRDLPGNQFSEPIPMETVRAALVDAFEQEYTYDFLIGSYFLAYRQPVTRDPAFRRYLHSVTTHDRKRDIVKRYEVGLTHWLIQHGHQFDTFVPHLYPFHPIFTAWYFRLLDDGFPLLKRYFLAENHYRVPQLRHWPTYVKEKVPGADVTTFERNLVRVTDPQKLQSSLNVDEHA